MTNQHMTNQHRGNDIDNTDNMSPRLKGFDEREALRFYLIPRMPSLAASQLQDEDIRLVRMPRESPPLPDRRRVQIRIDLVNIAQLEVN